MKKQRVIPDLPDSMRGSFRAWVAGEADPSRLLSALEEGTVVNPPVCHWGEAYRLSPADRGELRRELLLRVERAGGQLRLRLVILSVAEGQLRIRLPHKD